MHYNEPTIKRAIVFIDGQSLYRNAKEAFGYIYPNYDAKLLSEKICADHGWQNVIMSLKNLKNKGGPARARDHPKKNARYRLHDNGQNLQIGDRPICYLFNIIMTICQ